MIEKMQMRSSSAVSHRVKFRHLLCFLEVARLRSVNKAADVLGISQPAVSKTLRELEEALGVLLFDRSHRNVVLTSRGEIFLQHAGPSVSELRHGIDAILQSRTLDATPVIVGVLPTVSSRILPKAVSLLMKDGAQSKIRIVTGPNDFLLAQLREGDFDFVVGRMAEPELMKGLSFEHLCSEEVGFVVRRGHPLLSTKTFDFNMIEHYPVLMPPTGSAIRPVVERFLTAHGIGTLRDQIETVSTSFARSFTHQSDAIWIISKGVVYEDLKTQQLCLLPLDTSQTLGPVGLTRRKDCHLSLAAELLVRCIRQIAEETKKIDASWNDRP